MNILLLKNFNNYFNRTVKKYSSLADYKANAATYLEFTSINFNPNDGVSTELVLGGPTQTEGDQVLFWEYNGTPDYLVCYETGDNTDLIRSRWFVMESIRTRTGQYNVVLKRDVLAEHFDEVLQAPCFVEKGIVEGTENALLYNKESMTYNQIKKSETLLQDPTEAGWIVGYVAKNYNHTSGLQPGEINADDADPIDYIDAEDLPFTVSASAPTTVISADATATDINIMLPIAWVDARYGSWGTAYHRRMQSFNIYNKGTISAWTNSSTNSNQPYLIKDGALTTSTIETYGYTADNFLAGGTFNGVTFQAMNAAFNLSEVSQGTYVAETTNINSNLKLNVNMSGVVSDPTKISAVIKKYAADPTDISGGTYGNANRNLYVDYNKAIGTSAYNQMKAYYTANYNWNNMLSYYHAKMISKLAGYNNCIKTTSSGKLAPDYNGKIVKLSGKYYKMYVNSAGSYHVILYNTSSERMPTYTVNGTNTIQIDTDTSTTSNSYMNNIITSFANVKDDQNANLFTCQTSWKAGAGVIDILPKYTVVLEEIANEEVMTGGTSESFTGTEYTQGTTYDAAFDMFAIPYGRLAFKCAGSNNVYHTSKSEGIGIARWLATALGSNVYDLQILPYCPSDNIRTYMAENDTLDLSIISGHYQVIFRAAPNTSVSSTSDWSPCSFIFTPLSCKGTFDIECELPVSEDDWSNSLNYKIANETQLIRLCSPNWGSMFEFSLAKNDGVSKFNVDYTYKPSQPYIHINPDFKSLYGQDWDDSRGLILGGDFSVQTASSAWIDYVNNNKNYQSIFNRQIENLDVNNEIAQEQRQWGFTKGLINMAVDAATNVNPAQYLQKGVLNPFYTAWGGVQEADWMRRSQEEAKDYATDMYGYNLGNIRARPDSLARTEALTNNNKIWPVIEIYGCTDVEKTNLIEKIRYNGMTIMALGTLADYDYSIDFNKVYVKGQLIRLDTINDDFHVADALYQEVNKGFFVIQGGA